MISHFSSVRLFATLWTVAHQAPLPMGFSRQESWSELPCPPPGDLPHPGMEPESLVSPALAGRFFTAETPGKAISDAHISDYNESVGLLSSGFFGHTMFQLPLSALHYSGYL